MCLWSSLTFLSWASQWSHHCLVISSNPEFCQCHGRVHPSCFVESVCLWCFVAYGLSMSMPVIFSWSQMHASHVDLAFCDMIITESEDASCVYAWIDLIFVFLHWHTGALPVAHTNGCPQCPKLFCLVTSTQKYRNNKWNSSIQISHIPDGHAPTLLKHTVVQYNHVLANDHRPSLSALPNQCVISEV